MANVIDQFQVGTTSYPIKDGTAKSWDLSVSGTPVAVSSHAWWDTEEAYGYFLDVTATGMTDTMVILNFVATDTLMANLGPVVVSGNNKLTLYTSSNDALSGTIKVLAKEA